MGGGVGPQRPPPDLTLGLEAGVPDPRNWLGTTRSADVLSRPGPREASQCPPSPCPTGMEAWIWEGDWLWGEVVVLGRSREKFPLQVCERACACDEGVAVWVCG